MFSERTRLRLHDVIDNIDAIESYVGAMDLAALEADRKTVDAVERCLQRVTEALIQMGETDLCAIVPALPLAKVKGMGNLLRHEYRRVDLSVILATVKEDMPPLRAACVRALGGADG